MASIDSVSLTILFGAVLVLAGIMSSLVALRFGAPLLLVFLLVGLLAGESGIGGVKFDDVQTAYTVGSVALGLILFDGGLRTKFATVRTVLAPAGLLATAGVLITAGLTAPMALWMLGTTWTESFLVGAVMASTDAAAVFFLLHAKGLRLRPRVSATLEVESGINDPFAIFLTIVLVEILFSGHKPWNEIASLLIEKAVLGGLIGWLGGLAMVLVLNRLVLPQGMHAPFVAAGALVTFGFAESVHGSGFLAVYIAGLIVGNRETRAHNTIVTFLDAATWLAQIAMFVLLGLLAWPERLPQRLLPALMVALMLGAILLDRRAISLRTVAVAAIAILAVAPEALVTPGFQMSFAATASLILVFPAWSRHANRLPWIVRGAALLVLSSLIAGIATSPIAAAHFNRSAQYGLIANLLVVPVMGAVVMPAGVIAAVLGPLGLAGPALWAMGLGTRWMLFVGERVGDWGGAVLAVPAPPWMTPTTGSSRSGRP